MNSIKCPKCFYVRQLSDSVIPDWQCPKCGVVYAKFQASLNKFVKVRLTSGQELIINKVKLFDLHLVRKIENLRQNASKNFNGFSSGIGFFGSLESVAAASIVSGVIEGAISNQMAKQGANQLTEAARLSNLLRETASYVQVSSIENIKYPDFGMWRAVVIERSQKREMVHVASNYVFVESDEKETAVFWDKIEQYEYI